MQETMQRMTLPIQGMSCGGCVRNVRHALGRLPGVRVDNVSVGQATVSYDPGVTDRAAIVAAIERAGYATRTA